MPEQFRALIVVLVLATAVLMVARPSLCPETMSGDDFSRRRNLWLAITLTAFAASNFWIYIVVTAALLLFALPREANRIAMYFFLLLAVPPIDADISGLGVIKHFFSIDYLRLLALAVLLPTFLSLRAEPKTLKFGRIWPDRLLLAYLVLQFILMLSVSTVTNSLRIGVFYAFIDVFLPYYVASRGLKNLPALREALASFVVAALMLSAIGAFEFVFHWLLYASLPNALGTFWGYGYYLARGESLRAVGPTGQSIVVGYLVVVALGFLLALRKSLTPAVWKLGWCVLLIGLVAPVSRGPWIGMVALIVIFAAMGPAPGKMLSLIVIAGLLSIPVLLVVPGGNEVIDRLPFIGSVDSENVTYRQRLFQISLQVVMQHPFFGAFDYFYSPAMQELKQGSTGFIDLVNSYAGIALSSGLVGLSLFLSIFISIGAQIFKAFRRQTDRDSEMRLMGRALLGTLIAVLVIIFTVSSITFIPVVYWALAGLGVAYAYMLAPEKAAARATAPSGPSTGFEPAALRTSWNQGR